MARAVIPHPVLLFMSILYNTEADPADVVARLEAPFGKVSFLTTPMPFSFTDYYTAEMGSPLMRVIAAFSALVPRDCLVSVKSVTNELEDAYRIGGKRRVNLDPGILTLENVCLATTKPHAHRIYLGSGIWAEVTLIYKEDTYRALSWTYPDYASQDYINIFNTLRRDNKRRLLCRQPA